MAGPSVRAAILREPGAAVEIADVRLDPPGPGEVEVRIAAAGVCGSDLHVVVGDWDVPMPVVLGHEGAGVVSAVGDGVDDLAPGDHVVLSWVPQCGRCRQCRAGRPWQCQLVAEVVAPGGVLHDGTSRWHCQGRPARHWRQRPHCGTQESTTWSPAERSSTPSPTAVTTPAPS